MTNSGNLFTRRGFIGAVTAAIGVAGAVPACALNRKPFVAKDDAVDSIVWHLWDRERAPTGPNFVHEVLPWDGTGYPIILRQSSYTPFNYLFDAWYDFEWAVLRNEVPKQFWAMPGSERYPNIHSYVREQRFYEPPEVMRRIMERNRLAYPEHRGRDREPFAKVRWVDSIRAYEIVS